MFGRQSSTSTKTILLKSPDSDRVREVVITEIVVPNSRNSIDKLSLIDRMDTKIMSKSSRKRRLDHLTQEEKIMRKKLKNREAAQVSRDRKKARLEELESAVCLLQKQCDQLCEKYHSVCVERDDLKRELTAANEQLWRSRVEGGLKDASVLKDAAVMTEGPAVSSPPLPQGMTAPRPRSARHLHSQKSDQQSPSPLHHRHLHQLFVAVLLVIWQTWPMTSSTAGSATATRLARLTSKNSNCLPTHSSNRPSTSRKQTTWQEYHPLQNSMEIQWTPTDRPPPAPCLQTVCRLPALLVR